VDAWLRQAENYLVQTWGIAPDVAKKFALLWAYLYQYGLNPRITSGFRDPAKQRALQAAWDRGERQGLRARPATSSDHTLESQGFLTTKPASRAIDIVSTDESKAAAIARALGIGAGLDFKTPDPGHYFVRSV
jgi:hypothetical protein